MRHLLIPRLELQVAVMAVRLKEQIVKENEFMIQNSNFFVDSNTAVIDTQLSPQTSVCNEPSCGDIG